VRANRCNTYELGLPIDSAGGKVIANKFFPEMSITQGKIEACRDCPKTFEHVRAV
jgi:hypothetical protein